MNEWRMDERVDGWMNDEMYSLKHKYVEQQNYNNIYTHKKNQSQLKYQWNV